MWTSPRTRIVDYAEFSPSGFEQVPGPIYDAAIRWLAGHHHPQQRRQLLHSHQQTLKQFCQDSAAQWDSEYIVNRYSQSHPLQDVYPTPEIKQNIEADNLGDSGNLPIRKGTSSRSKGDALSINELQYHLSNQAAALRMKMTNEYEDLRIFQNSELELLIKAKAKSEPEFSKLIDDIRVHGNRHRPLPLKPPPQPQSTNNISSVSQSPVAQQIQSSVLSSSPSDLTDINLLKNDPSLPSFVKFFLHLQVVQQNWTAICGKWAQYVDIFQRELMTEENFAKAILEDAVRAAHPTPTPKFTKNELSLIQTTRETAKQIPENMVMSRIIMNVILDMAEAGDIEFTKDPIESMGESFGPQILLDAMRVEPSQMHQASIGGVGKATDPRQR